LNILCEIKHRKFSQDELDAASVSKSIEDYDQILLNPNVNILKIYLLSDRMIQVFRLNDKDRYLLNNLYVSQAELNGK